MGLGMRGERLGAGDEMLRAGEESSGWESMGSRQEMRVYFSAPRRALRSCPGWYSPCRSASLRRCGETHPPPADARTHLERGAE